MPDFDTPAIFKLFMGALRFGRGLLGRSSNAFIGLIALGAVAIWRLHSDILIAGVFGIAVVVFLIWYFRIERFAYKHPLETLLEGADYTAHHQMLLATKGQPAILASASKDSPTTNPVQIEQEQTS